MKQRIYVLANSADPDVVKVGMTDNLHRRIGQMNSLSSTVGEWSILDSWEIPETMDLVKAEQAALESLQRCRVLSRREQFKVNYEEAIREVGGAVRAYMFDELAKMFRNAEPGDFDFEGEEGRQLAILMDRIFYRLSDENGKIPELDDDQILRVRAFIDRHLL